MITRIEATRYRCFERLDVELGEYNVLAGANGSGKTTLLDIPSLLGDLLSQRVISAAFLEAKPGRAPRAHSLQELIHKGRGDDFILALEAKLPERITRDLLEGATTTVRQNQERWPTHLRYEVRLQIFNEIELHIQNEYLFTFPQAYAPSHNHRLHGEQENKRDWKFTLRREYGGESEFYRETENKKQARKASIGPAQLALPLMWFESAEDYPAARWLYDILVDQTIFYRPNLVKLRQASPPGQPDGLMADGSNLPWLGLQLKQNHPDRFQDWMEMVQIALPQLDSIDVIEREEDHHAYLKVNYHGGYQVTSSGLSDGTLRILAFAILPFLPRPPALLISEEPENGIHPRAIEAILQVLKSMYDSQVWISTHSPIVLAGTDLEAMLCMRMSDTGNVEAIAGPQHPHLLDWKGGIDLGSLFAAGVLG